MGRKNEKPKKVGKLDCRESYISVAARPLAQVGTAISTITQLSRQSVTSRTDERVCALRGLSRQSGLLRSPFRFFPSATSKPDLSLPCATGATKLHRHGTQQLRAALVFSKPFQSGSVLFQSHFRVGLRFFTTISERPFFACSKPFQSGSLLVRSQREIREKRKETRGEKREESR